jgi:PKD repeat protein
MSRISSLDTGYVTGQLSLFPGAIDDVDQLYWAKNNAQTFLKISLAYNGQNIVVDNASAFPPSGLLVLGPLNSPNPEFIYYSSRTNSVFSGLQRGFAKSRQNSWSALSTNVSNSVMAEHHNAVKDALLNVENYLGTSTTPAQTSVNGILSALEEQYLAPNILYQAYPLGGAPPLSVRFQNFSENIAIRYLWDFGDGTQSTERSPTHVYAQEGAYTVTLNIITSIGGQGVQTKNNYIIVDNSKTVPFFYTEPTGNTNQYQFIDQTDANIQQRYWIFDDGVTTVESNPNVHTVIHTYPTNNTNLSKTYNPSLILIYSDSTTQRVFLNNSIVILPT